MDLDKAFTTHSVVTDNKFICANIYCKQINTKNELILNQRTYTCEFCKCDQYCANKFMYLGKDAFTEEIDFLSDMGYM